MAISSTVNVPNDFTVEEVEDMYMYAWEKGIKGLTLYRDGCQRLGILTTDETEKKRVEEQKEVKKEEIKEELVCPECGGEMFVSNGCEPAMIVVTPCSIRGRTNVNLRKLEEPMME